MNKNMIESREQFLDKIREAYNVIGSAGYAMLQCTDKFCLYELSEGMDVFDIETIWKHGFDIRVFGSKGEYHFVRGSIDRPFILRIIDEEEGDYYDEVQFLDIDTDRSRSLAGEGKAMTTGGGTYMLPLKHPDGAGIVIRNYIGYEETGRTYVKDWRCVTLKEGK